MSPSEFLKNFLPQNTPIKDSTDVHFAPSNIALVKYWGKRSLELNLPLTDSLSIGLKNKGTSIAIKKNTADLLFINDKLIEKDHPIFKRLFQFLNFFRVHPNFCFEIHSISNIPIAAGLASSASAFAALVMALNDFFSWELSKQQCSILARMGSGSACRSLWDGFVHWKKGEQADGSDSFGIPLKTEWSDLRIGLLIFTDAQKPLSSREAMARTKETSRFFKMWPQIVRDDISTMLHAIQTHDFHLLGKTAEQNAIAMHASMQTAFPPIYYSLPQTLENMHKIWQLRHLGLNIFFTQDAGPNLKLIYEAKDSKVVNENFPGIIEIKPF